MRFHRLLSMAIFALIVPTAARAADLATIGCVRNQLSTGAVDALSAHAKRYIVQGQKDLLSRPVDAELFLSSRLCRTKNKWSENAGNFAAVYTIWAVYMNTIEGFLKSDGIDGGGITKSLDSLSESDLESFYSEKTSDKASEVITSVLASQKISADDSVRVWHVLVFAAWTAKLSNSRAAFASS